MATETESTPQTADNVIQLFRVPHTVSPFRPLLPVYRPFTPVESIRATGLIPFNVSYSTTGFPDGTSNDLSTRIASSPSLLSPRTIVSAIAFNVVTLSIEKR